MVWQIFISWNCIKYEFFDTTRGRIILLLTVSQRVQLQLMHAYDEFLYTDLKKNKIISLRNYKLSNTQVMKKMILNSIKKYEWKPHGHGLFV